MAVLEAGITTVPVDIDPNSAANEVDPDSTGQIPVAVYTTSVLDGDDSNFDAAQIDMATLRFDYGQASPVSGPTTADLDGDGDLEYSYMFRIDQAGIVCDDIDAPLTGSTTTGQAFAGVDAITTINCSGGGCHP